MPLPANYFVIQMLTFTFAFPFFIIIIINTFLMFAEKINNLMNLEQFPHFCSYTDIIDDINMIFDS